SCVASWSGTVSTVMPLRMYVGKCTSHNGIQHRKSVGPRRDIRHDVVLDGAVDLDGDKVRANRSDYARRCLPTRNVPDAAANACAAYPPSKSTTCTSSG